MISRQKREDAKFAALEELMEDQGEEDGDAAGGSPSQQHEPTVDDVEREVFVRNVCDTLLSLVSHLSRESLCVSQVTPSLYLIK